MSARFMVLVGATLLAGCGMHGRPKVERKAPAKAVASASQDSDRVVAPGIVEPWGGEVLLSPLEPGTLSQLLVKEGESVESGKVLALLDDGVQRAAVDLAKADVAEAEASLSKTLHGATAEELRLARADVRAADTKSALANKESKRAHQLADAGAMAAADVDRADADAEVQASLARVAAEKLKTLERGSRAEDRSAAGARVAAARARLDAAETNLARRRIVAPSAATILLSRYHVGERFELGGAPMFVLGDLTRLQVRLEVDEIDAFRAKPGAACTIVGDDGKTLVDGAVLRLAPKMGRRTLAIESPTARADVRVREVFVEVTASPLLVPGRRIWGHLRVGDASATRHVD